MREPERPAPTPSRFAVSALVFSLVGLVVGLFVAATVVFGASLSSQVWWTVLVGGLVGLTGWAVVAFGLNALAVGRVLASRKGKTGVPLALTGLSAATLLGAPGGLLVGIVLLLVGLLLSGTIGFGNAGRPLRVAGRPWRAGLTVRGLRRPRRFRPSVAAAWAQAASAEHSAVGAFRQLALDLAAHGAPDDLVRRCRAAAVEEERHARDSAELAARFGGVELGFAAFPASPAAPLPDLAVSSLVDGVVGEGFAAGVAAAAADVVDDPEVGALLRTIAREEASHARLSRAILAWCRRVGGEPVQQALSAAVALRPAPVSDQPLAGGVAGRHQDQIRRRVVRRAARTCGGLRP